MAGTAGRGVGAEEIVCAGERVYQSVIARYAHTKFIGLETISLLNRRPFLGDAFVFAFGEAVAAAGGERGAIFSYLGPATTVDSPSSFDGPHIRREAVAVGIRASRS